MIISNKIFITDSERRLKCSFCQQRWCRVLPRNSSANAKPCAKDNIIGFCELCNKETFALNTEKTSRKQSRSNKTPKTAVAKGSEIAEATSSVKHFLSSKKPSTTTSNIPTSNVTTKITTDATTTITDQLLLESTTKLNLNDPEENQETIAFSNSESPDQSSTSKEVKSNKIRGKKLPLPLRNRFTHNYDSETHTLSTERPSYENMTRYQSRRSNSSNILFKLPASKITTICNIINKFMSYDPVVESEVENDIYTTFMTMGKAKEYVIRKLHVFRDDLSIMQFKYPTALSHYQPQNYEYNNDIDLNIRDIESVFDKHYLNDEILSFCMKCLNLLNLETSSSMNIPDVLFGSVPDYSNVVINKDNVDFGGILKHIGYGDTYGEMTQSFSQSESEALWQMKHWYCGTSKHYLSKLLDRYASRNQIITKYVNILHVQRVHWILLVAEISSKEKDFVPCVYTMDGLRYPDNDAKNARIWFAKFFGLYTKQFYSPNRRCSIHDFDCHDIIDSFNNKNPEYIVDEIDRKNISMLKQEAKPPSIVQRDSYNCGVIGLVHCIEMYRKNEKFKNFDPEQQHEGLLRLRLNIVSMIVAIYEELNNEHYLPFKDHLWFDEHSGNCFNKHDLEKWDKIHSLFDADTYRYDSDPRKANYVNANTMYVVTSNKKINDDMNSTFPSPSPKKRSQTPKKSTSSTFGSKRRRKSSLKKTTATPQTKSPTKTPSSRNSERKIKNQKQTGFLDQLQDYSIIKKSLLKDYEHNWIRRVFDVSDTYLYLSDNDIKDQELVTPKEIIDSIVTLMTQCYVSRAEAESDRRVERKFSAKVKDLIETYDTYFLMDLIPDKEKELKTYEVVAAVIVEDDIELDKETHVLMHMMGVRRGFECLNYHKILLHNMIYGSKMANMNFVILKSFGNRNYVNEKGNVWFGVFTPETVFLQMGFNNTVSKPSLNVAIGEMIEPNSLIMYGKGSDVVKKTKRYSQFFEKKEYEDCKILNTHNHVKFLLRYQTSTDQSISGNFEMWNHTCLWRQATTQQIDYVLKSDQNMCIENPNKILILKGGGRREEHSEFVLNESQKKWKIDENILSNAQKSKNNCVWLATVLLVQLNHHDIAQKMMEMLNEDNASYQWMFLTKIPRSRQYSNEHGNVPLLITALRHPNIGYTLKKVDIGSLGISYVDYLFMESTSGQYICQLETSGGDTKHVIGIDKGLGVILDASETHALEFTRDNLDYCSGKKFRNIRKIIYCYELCKRI